MQWDLCPFNALWESYVLLSQTHNSVLLSRCVQIYLFFLQWRSGTSLETWTSTETLSCDGDCLRQCFQSYQTTAKRDWSQFMDHCRVHSWDWGLYAYYPAQAWARLLPAPLAYGAGTHSSHRHFCLLISAELYCWRKDKMSDG